MHKDHEGMGTETIHKRDDTVQGPEEASQLGMLGGGQGRAGCAEIGNRDMQGPSNEEIY